MRTRPPRTRLSSVGSGVVVVIRRARSVTVWASWRSISTPSPSTSASMVRTSAMSGRLWRRTGSSVSSAAAISGKAAFLLPLGVTVPRSGTPPSMTSSSMATTMLWYARRRRRRQMTDHFRFVHITDTHIMAGGAWRMRGTDVDFDTDASLRRVVDTVRRLDPAPAFAVLGGDLTSPDLLHRDRVLKPAEYASSYMRLKEILAGLPCRAHFRMGNHDNLEAFNRALRPEASVPDAPCYYSFDHDGTHLIALDSHEPGHADGVLDPAQLAWLARDLAAHRDTPTIVFIHHHPWPLGHAWMDTMTLRNGGELMAMLAGQAQVRWVIGGHVHSEQLIQRGGLALRKTPSTCIQPSKVA